MLLSAPPQCYSRSATVLIALSAAVYRPSSSSAPGWAAGAERVTLDVPSVRLLLDLRLGPGCSRLRAGSPGGASAFCTDQGLSGRAGHFAHTRLCRLRCGGRSPLFWCCCCAGAILQGCSSSVRLTGQLGAFCQPIMRLWLLHHCTRLCLLHWAQPAIHVMIADSWDSCVESMNH